VDHGIDADRLSAVGFGKTQPAYSNETDEGRAKNRRVELRPIR
jgi:OOP family OmpA-OmpF porin